MIIPTLNPMPVVKPGPRTDPGPRVEGNVPGGAWHLKEALHDQYGQFIATFQVNVSMKGWKIPA